MYTEKLIKNCLIVVPTTNLRNNEWVNEIEAWAPEINQIVTIECIQTAYKFTEETHYDLIIVDEIHTTLSMEYRKVYEISYNYILGLTATIPHQEEYEELLNIIAPVIYSVNLNEAVKLKLITPYILYNLPVTFNRKERALYTAYTKMFTTAASAVKEQAFDYYAKVRTMKGHKHYKLANMF